MIRFGAPPVSSATIVAALTAKPSVWPDGTTNAPGAAFAAEPSTGFRRLGSGQTAYCVGGADRLNFAANTIVNQGSYGWSSGAVSSFDTAIFRDAAGTLAQRNGVNAQAFRIYNTFTDSSNYERAALKWSSNVFVLDSQEIAGTGVARALRLQAAGTVIGVEDGAYTPANGPVAPVSVRRDGTSAQAQFGVYGIGLTSTNQLHTRLAPSINQASGTYTILDINPTETSIGAGPHYLVRGRIGAGGNVFSVDRTGIISTAAGFASGLRFAGSTQLLDIGDGLLGISDSGLNGAAIRLTERTDPSAPSGNNAYFYCRDDGGGKTQLVVRFPTGAIQVIATEP
ncbi:MAG: hypothetical protein K2X72_19610 [Reyranella sp.]|nr:hypothetical protein [Reyranella sp.]